MDKGTYDVLEQLQRLTGTAEDVMGGWFYPVTIAHALGLHVDEVADEFDILADEGLAEIKDGPDRQRISKLASVSKKGNAVLAQARKASRRLATSTTSAAVQRDEIIIKTRDGDTAYDVFLSYASEDRAFAIDLRNKLADEGLSVWMDLEKIDVGETIVKTIEAGLSASRHALVLLSSSYVKKPYTKAEFDVVIKRQIEEGRGVILPVLLGDISQEAVQKFSPLLSTVRNIRVGQGGSQATVDELLRVLRPPVIGVSTPPETPIAPKGHSGPDSGRPFDALPDDPRLTPSQPRLNIIVAAYAQEDPQHVALTYQVRNVGAGSASKVRVFLPGLIVDSPGQPISSTVPYTNKIAYEERRAFLDLMPVSAQAIAEYEDSAGNLYRQYGRIAQERTDSGWFKYDIEELDRPYLVPQRIVESDPTRVKFRR